MAWQTIRNSEDIVTWLVDQSGVNDSSAIIQSAIDHLYNTFGGGKLFVPTGNFRAQNLTMRGGVTLIGGSRRHSSIFTPNDATIFAFDATCSYAGFSDLFVAGYAGENPAQNLVYIAPGAPVTLRRSNIWGGNAALFTQGVDGVVEDCYIKGYGLASILSTGANWYRRVKIDTDAGNPCVNGFYQGAPFAGLSGVAENHLDQCDLSGDYHSSLTVQDDGAHSAVTILTGCVTSRAVNLGSAKFTSFVGHEFGAEVNSGVGSVSITGSVALIPLNVPGAVKAGNVGIT